MKTKQAFTLVELMIVLVIMGVLASLVITSFDYSQTNIQSDAVTVEMVSIRKAFVRYYNNNFPDSAEYGVLHTAAKYGLAVLCIENPEGSASDEENLDTACREVDRKNRIGWFGPYIMQEGNKACMIGEGETWQGDVVLETSSVGSLAIIPVVYDPYGGYYRIIVPYGNLGGGSAYYPKRVFLVCTGPNKKLETSSFDFDDDESSPTYGNLIAKGDDVALQLLSCPLQD